VENNKEVYDDERKMHRFIPVTKVKDNNIVKN
jgi:hypothetical protein